MNWQAYCAAQIYSDLTFNSYRQDMNEVRVHVLLGLSITTIMISDPDWFYVERNALINCTKINHDQPRSQGHNVVVPDQIGTLSQVGTKKISEGGWTI